MLFMFIPLHVFSEDVQSISGYCGANGDNLVWTFTKSDSSLVIEGRGDMANYGNSTAPWKKYSKCIKKVNVSEGVSTIGVGAFEYMGLVEVKLPSSLKKIEVAAFSDNEMLNSVCLPDSVSEISANAFWGCVELERINLNHVNNIGENAFYKCGLIEIQLSNEVESIGTKAFYDCVKLGKVNFGHVKIIGDNAFYRCGISEALFSEGLEKIGDKAFGGCSSLKKVTLPKVYDKIELGVSAFWDCEQLEEADLGTKGELYLRSGAFANCINLKRLNLGDSVSIVSYYGVDRYGNVSTPFSNCVSLPTIIHKGVLYHMTADKQDEYILPADVTTIAIDAFCESQTKNIIMSSKLHSVYGNAFADNKYIETVDFSRCAYVQLGDGAFKYSTLSNIIGMDKVTYLSSQTFKGCPIKGELVLSDSIFMNHDNLWDGYGSTKETFAGCGQLTSVVLPNVNFMTLGDGAFCDCKNLKRINCDNVASIGRNVFSGCASLDSLTFYKLNEIYTSSFNNCTGLKSISLLMDKVPYMRQWNDETSDLSKVKLYVPIYLSNEYRELFNAKVVGVEESFSGICGEFGDNIHWSINTKEGVLRFVGTGCITKFDISPNCSRINACKKVEIDTRINKIGSGVFANYSLQDLVLGDNILEVGDSAFYKAKINKVTAGKKLEKIGDSAFAGSTLKELANGENISSIGKSAFALSQLRRIRFSNKLKVIHEGAFTVSKIDSLIIPDSTKMEGRIAARCEDLRYVVLPKDLQRLPDNFFWNTHYVKDVYIKSSEIYNPSYTWGDGWEQKPTLHIPMGSLNFYREHYGSNRIYDEFYSLINCFVCSYEDRLHGTVKIGCNTVNENCYHDYYERGSSLSLKFYPNEGCHLQCIRVNDIWPDELQELPKDSLVFNNLQESKNIYVYFARNEYGLSVESTKGGKIRVLNNDVDIAASYKVLYNDTVHFEFLPNEGYELEKVLLNDEDITQKVEENLFDLTISGDNKLKVFYKDSTSSSIDKITFDTDIHKTPLYNLNGQRISNEYKGIRVKKGKKWIGK